jgi:hypothetical protein
MSASPPKTTLIIKNGIFASAFALVSISIFAIAAQVYAKDISQTIPSLENFIQTVVNGNASTVRGVYVTDTMALNVVQQPEGHPNYVSTDELAATQFGTAAKAGTIGLLAHNTHAGALFSHIGQGNIIVLVYGDGNTKDFVVQDIQQYQALEPLNPHSKFINLETQSTHTAEEVFNAVYRGGYPLTLQTCIENEGNASWGRLFVMAEPTAKKNAQRNESLFSAFITLMETMAAP